MSSLESAIRILQSLSPQKPTLRVSDAAAELDIPKSTVSRLLKTLSEGGILERQDGGREYSVGPLLLQLGGLYVSTHSVLDLVDRSLLRLVETFGFTAYAGILDGADVVVLRQWQGSHPLRLVLDVGSRLPAEQTALGLSLLSNCEDAVVAERLGASVVHPVTGEAIPLADTLKDVRRCREAGWIQVACATAPGITSIGAVITARNASQPDISISVSFPDHAADDALRSAMAAEIIKAAREITELSSMPLQLSGPRNPGATRSGR
ncbi:IclR family transcriptional regulator [Chelatococcus sp. YT9]|uniref:IclR family transcriptional regulator n=1 Tax=Chelatococcus sp. YT9 TaxID=2835635 RepID=UPI001BCB25E9|nr:IclR family transcriptional regulator [Chelatococcus sp. YT9]MBS7701279.1 IclR family transcriptional regulator [Chelatococcus sp. YT9]